MDISDRTPLKVHDKGYLSKKRLLKDGGLDLTPKYCKEGLQLSQNVFVVSFKGPCHKDASAPGS